MTSLIRGVTMIARPDNPHGSIGAQPLRFVLAVLAAMCLAGATPATLSAGLARAELDQLHKHLRPDKDDAWRALPWRTSVLDAREQATLLKRPVYMLVRSGSPLGCV